MREQDYRNQLIGVSTDSVTYGCPQFFPAVPTIYSAKKLTIEAVEGGYIISGCFKGSAGDARTVAINADGLCKIVKGWCGQFEAKSK